MLKVTTKKKVQAAREANQEWIDELTAQRGRAQLETRALKDVLRDIQWIARRAGNTGLNDDLEAQDVAKILRRAEEALGTDGQPSPLGNKLPEEWRTPENAKS